MSQARLIAVIAALPFAMGLASSSQDTVGPALAATRTVMSFHNRLLLNRLAINGYKTVQAMLIVRPGRFQAVIARLAQLGAHVRRAEPDVDYIRAEISIDRVAELGTISEVEAYQLASLASPSWYPSAHTKSRAEIERNGEVAPVARLAAERRTDLPQLSPEETRADGYTANEDAGVGRWYAEHPRFDGRGVTIAFLETALVEFGHPTLQVAKTLDGVDVPKIIGILNTLGPDDPDTTRVELGTQVNATSAWHQAGNRTYILPRPGTYRFGVFMVSVAADLLQPFAVIRDESTGEVWVDSNADADFRGEQPLIDANTRIDVRHLHVSHPRPIDLPFVFTRGRTAHEVHVYLARSAHHTMSLSVATGNATGHELASGVAPGARALVVRYSSHLSQFHSMVEGYLETARRSDVDILCDSTGLETVPDAGREFASIFFRRLVATYRKPIFHSAGNAGQTLSTVSALGGVFSVGGTLGPASFAALYGGAVLPHIVVHPLSAAGPGIDGAVEPEFLAPENRISAGVWVDDGYVPLPKHAPKAYLPSGYDISCCTSASSPYAAGVAALLLSAAKQSGTPYSVDSLDRALRLGARFLPGWPAYKQGNGVLDVNNAWRELQHTAEIPRIVASTSGSHALTPYVAGGSEGPGIFEQHGWKTGQQGQRLIHLTRHSGVTKPVRYRVSWAGNDGTFAAPSTITLPLNLPATLPVTIRVTVSGAHSALLNLHDPTDTVVFRTQVTIVAPESFDAKSGDVRLAGSISLMHAREHFVHVPKGTGALSVEMTVNQGALLATLTPPDRLNSGYFDHVRSANNRTFTKGRYHFLWPSPPAGTWSLDLRNTSAVRERDHSLVSTTDATYSITVRLVSASIEVADTNGGEIRATVKHTLGVVREPALAVSSAVMRSTEAATWATGLPTVFEIDVPNAASSLRIAVRALTTTEPNLELSLHDCTSGECFLWDFTLPADSGHTMVVRKPTAGRWLAVVNAAPSPTDIIRFSFDEIIATDPFPDAAPVTSKSAGETWTQTLRRDRASTKSAERQHVWLFELFDEAAARNALEYPWENRKGVTSLADRPAAIGTAVWRPK